MSFADTGVSPNTSYTYSVKAFDAAGNYSAASNAIQVTTPAAPVSNSTCPTTAVSAFTGCYYSNIILDGAPAMVRTDSQINFDWGGNPPDRSVGRGAFSVRWQGSFEFDQGAYTFTALTSDGMRLYIDGNLVLDRWFDQACHAVYRSADAQPGRSRHRGGVLRAFRLVGRPPYVAAELGEVNAGAGSGKLGKG